MKNKPRKHRLQQKKMGLLDIRLISKLKYLRLIYENLKEEHVAKLMKVYL